MIIYNHSVPSTSGKGLQIGEGIQGFLSGGRKVHGKTGNKALVIGFAAAVMTLSKTVLYCKPHSIDTRINNLTQPQT